MAQLKVGFILARRFTLSAFANFVDVLRLAADRLIRLELAKHLLRATARPATQIAADTGFCDLPHLIRAFRAAEGVTPDAYRRAAALP